MKIVTSVSQADEESMPSGFMQSDINIISNKTGPIGIGYSTTQHAKGAISGARNGRGRSGAAGVALILMGLAIPGIGAILAAGALAAALAGAGAGAVARGLTDIGVSDTHAEYYAEAARRGSALITVRANESIADEAEPIMHPHRAFDIVDRAGQWRQSGWEVVESSAVSYSLADIEREHARYNTADVRGATLRPLDVLGWPFPGSLLFTDE